MKRSILFWGWALGLTMGATAQSQIILTYDIAQSHDDVAQSLADGSLRADELDLALGQTTAGSMDPGDQIIGLRFTGIQIPRHARVSAAYVQFTSSHPHGNADPFNVIITGESVSNALPFKVQPFHLSTRRETEPHVVWSDIDPWLTQSESGFAQRTPDIASLIEEIVTRSDWQPGNDLALMFRGTGARHAVSFEGAAEKGMLEQAPTLVVALSIDYHFQLQQGWDDAIENQQSGLMTTQGDTLPFGQDGSQALLTGIRFPNVAFPSEWGIHEATIQFTSAGVEPGPNLFRGDIAGLLAGHTEPFAAEGYNISKRPRTKKTTSWWHWEPWDSPGQSLALQRTPNMVRVINELIEQPAWQPGQAMAFVLTGTGTNTAVSYEGSVLEPPFGAAPELCIRLGTHQQVRVAMDTDDMEEYVDLGTMDEGSSDLELCTEAFYFPPVRDPQIIGVRFQQLNIPSGVLIGNAFIQFACDETEFNLEPFNITVRGIAEDNTETFAFVPYDVSSRPRTQAKVTWSDIPPWEVAQEAGPNQRTPNLRDLVQEIVDRPGWQAGNALGFIFTGTGSRSALTYEGSREQSKSHLAPTLHVTYIPNPN